jgi:hypothetical protein
MAECQHDDGADDCATRQKHQARTIAAGRILKPTKHLWPEIATEIADGIDRGDTGGRTCAT